MFKVHFNSFDKTNNLIQNNNKFVYHYKYRRTLIDFFFTFSLSEKFFRLKKSVYNFIPFE